MRILPWRPRTTPPSNDPVSRLVAASSGSYAGRARYRPRDWSQVDEEQQAAIGGILDLQFVRVAANDEPFAGQALFRRWPGHGPLLPEQDLDFLG